MSDSPASRPKRSSNFASFYIDEDDFEDDSVLNSGRSKKTENEDVFIISDKFKGIETDTDSDKSDVEEFELKPATKVKSKPAKKQNGPKLANTKTKTKSNVSNNTTKSVAKIKALDEDDFELVVDEDSSESEAKSSKSKNGKYGELEENIDKGNASDKPKSKPATKKAKVVPQTTTPMSSTPKSLVIPNRFKLPTSIEKVKIPGQWNGPRRVGLSKVAPTKPLSPVKLKKFD